VNMKRISENGGFVREYDRYVTRQQLSQDPLKWLGKWMVGRVVYLVYMGILLALFFWYYYIFLPWRDK
jgi:hypothetical protein